MLKITNLTLVSSRNLQVCSQCSDSLAYIGTMIKLIIKKGLCPQEKTMPPDSTQQS